MLLLLTPNSGMALNSAPHCFSIRALLSLRAVWGLPLELRRPPGKTTLLSGPGHWVLGPFAFSRQHTTLSILHSFKPLKTCSNLSLPSSKISLVTSTSGPNSNISITLKQPCHQHGNWGLVPKKKKSTSESSKYLSTAALHTREISPWPRGLAPNLYLELSAVRSSESISAPLSSRLLEGALATDCHQQAGPFEKGRVH